MIRIPRLLVAGTHSGVGKTTATLGILRLLARQGIRVQPFKAGPDYIDPGYHSLVSGRLCRNLDSWLVPPRRLPQLFQQGCRGADAAVIEGVMGLYDGVTATGDAGSTAELAKRLNCPVLLVVDAAAASRSAAAVVRGFKGMDRKVRIAGCIVNRLAGPGHYRLVKEAIERLAGVPVVGWLPRDPALMLPERHLGLVPAAEGRDLSGLIERLDRWTVNHFDAAAIRKLMQRASPLIPFTLRQACPERSRRAQGERTTRVPIAVAKDAAFHFYYPENLELLEQQGAEIVPFSPLKDRRLPSGIGALYVGGGFPELFVRELSANRLLHAAVRRALKNGLPTYAECGGLMWLSRSIEPAGGRSHPMVGLIPARIRMTDHLQNFGYKQVRALRASILAQEGETARGHEFHHSRMESSVSRKAAAYTASSRSGSPTQWEGYVRGPLLASYIHLHFGSQPRWAKRFVQAAKVYINHPIDVKVGSPLKSGAAPQL